MLIFDAAGAGEAAEMLRRGGLVAFPTETVYGLGADAFNPAALARVFEAKGRPRFDPLIIHIAREAALERLVLFSALPARRRALLEKLVRAFWPGPLTLVLPKRPEVPGLATAGLPTAAIRFPSHPLAQTLIRLCGEGAVAAPSANPFGRLSPTRAEHVAEGLGGKIDGLLDGGPSPLGIESTVLDLASGRPAILRPGGLPREAIERVTGPLAAPAPGAAAPGMQKSHYAPAVPLVLHDPPEMAALPPARADAYLFFSRKNAAAWLARAERDAAGVLALSEDGNALEAAANLFDFLHRLEALKPARIHAETAPEEGLGAAINDRLRRAAA